MYNNLHNALKKRMLDEAEGAYRTHPAFSKKVRIFNKFPYEERIQYGVVLRNTAASQIRMSADNFLSDLFSLVKLTGEAEYPQTSIEWVRENQGNITELYTEDVSSQFDSTIRVFSTTYPILKGPGNPQYAEDPGQVTIKINGIDTFSQYVYGKKSEVWLHRAPAASDTVTIQYYRRLIEDPGIFFIDFISDNQFLVNPYYIIENEVVINKIAGTETSVSLANQNIKDESENLIIGYSEERGRLYSLNRNIDYTINYTTGAITFLVPLEKNYTLYADYLYVPSSYDTGPYTFKNYQEIHSAIPGVVISIGRRAQQGDQQIIIVSQIREQQARIFGGHWDMSLDMAVIAKDPMQMEEMSDRLVEYLWSERKNILENEGITLNSVEPTGESEEVHIDITGDLYYESSVSINVMTEWQLFDPYLPIFRIKDIIVKPGIHPVIKGPIGGYERLT